MKKSTKVISLVVMVVVALILGIVGDIRHNEKMEEQARKAKIEATKVQIAEVKDNIQELAQKCENLGVSVCTVPTIYILGLNVLENRLKEQKIVLESVTHAYHEAMKEAGKSCHKIDINHGKAAITFTRDGEVRTYTCEISELMDNLEYFNGCYWNAKGLGGGKVQCTTRTVSTSAHLASTSTL